MNPLTLSIFTDFALVTGQKKFKVPETQILQWKISFFDWIDDLAHSTLRMAASSQFLAKYQLKANDRQLIL